MKESTEFPFSIKLDSAMPPDRIVMIADNGSKVVLILGEQNKEVA